MSLATDQKGSVRLNVGWYRGHKDCNRVGVTASQRPGYPSGFRVPLLNDVDNKYPVEAAPNSTATCCRFDIVESVKTVIKPGEYGQSDNPLVPYTQLNCARPDTVGNKMDAVQQRIPMSRQPTFHSTAVRHMEKGVKDTWGKISPYQWNHPPKPGQDARDTLYRNTYCLDKHSLRYTRSTLPRITQERSWTIIDSQDWKKTPKTEGCANDPKLVTIIPQQPRGTVVRFSEYMRPVTYTSDGKILEVKRFSSQPGQPTFSQVSTLRSMFPVIRNHSRKVKKGERPMKFENSRYKPNRGTHNNKAVHRLPPSIILQKDYHSADNFNEYLESLQQEAEHPAVPTREPTRQESRESQTYDFHNQALQSVVKVNQPEVEPSAPPVTEESSGCGVNRSRSAITIEIKPSWQETADTDKDTDSVPPSAPRDTVLDAELVDSVPDNVAAKSRASSVCNSDDAVNIALPTTGIDDTMVDENHDGTLARPNSANDEEIAVNGSDEIVRNDSENGDIVAANHNGTPTTGETNDDGIMSNEETNGDGIADNGDNTKELIIADGSDITGGNEALAADNGDIAPLDDGIVPLEGDIEETLVTEPGTDVPGGVTTAAPLSRTDGGPASPADITPADDDQDRPL